MAESDSNLEESNGEFLQCNFTQALVMSLCILFIGEKQSRNWWISRSLLPTEIYGYSIQSLHRATAIPKQGMVAAVCSGENFHTLNIGCIRHYRFPVVERSKTIWVTPAKIVSIGWHKVECEDNRVFVIPSQLTRITLTICRRIHQHCEI